MNILIASLMLVQTSSSLRTLDSELFSQESQKDFIVATARIVTEAKENQQFGSAVAIYQSDDQIYLLTAYHVVEGRKFTVEFFLPKTYPLPTHKLEGIIVESSIPRDVALIKVRLDADQRRENFKIVPLAEPGKRPKKYPYQALSVGCTHASAPSLEAEVISAKSAVRRSTLSSSAASPSNEDLCFFWKLQGETTSGRSGGPVIDQNGFVIGICSASQDGVSFFTHLDEILVELKKDYAWLWQRKK